MRRKIRGLLTKAIEFVLACAVFGAQRDLKGTLKQIDTPENVRETSVREMESTAPHTIFIHRDTATWITLAIDESMVCSTMKICSEGSIGNWTAKSAFEAFLGLVIAWRPGRSCLQ